jgi:hypothetical protein
MAKTFIKNAKRFDSAIEGFMSGSDSVLECANFLGIGWTAD